MSPKALKLHLQSIKFQKSFYSLNFCYLMCAMTSRFAKFQVFFSSTILIPESLQVVSESGQPHMRSFVTRCSVGDRVTEGEGNGKKISKKRAAKAMLEELRKLAPLPNMTMTNAKAKQKNPVNKKKNRNLIKMQKACPDYGLGINPISRLIQIQQAKKEKDPIYTLAEERGQPRRREFVMQVSTFNFPLRVCL
jgi:dsRNA-specific ribonuclease